MGLLGCDRRRPTRPAGAAPRRGIGSRAHCAPRLARPEAGTAEVSVGRLTRFFAGLDGPCEGLLGCDGGVRPGRRGPRRRAIWFGHTWGPQLERVGGFAQFLALRTRLGAGALSWAGRLAAVGARGAPNFGAANAGHSRGVDTSLPQPDRWNLLRRDRAGVWRLPRNVALTAPQSRCRKSSCRRAHSSYKLPWCGEARLHTRLLPGPGGAAARCPNSFGMALRSTFGCAAWGRGWRASTRPIPLREAVVRAAIILSLRLQQASALCWAPLALAECSCLLQALGRVDGLGGDSWPCTWGSDFNKRRN